MHSLRQTHDEFDDFFFNFEHDLCDIIARNSLFVVFIDDVKLEQKNGG